MKTLATLTLLALVLVAPAQAEAPTISDRVTHLEETMDGLLNQLENCIPRAQPYKTVQTKRGKQTLYVAVLTEQQRRVCFRVR